METLSRWLSRDRERLVLAIAIALVLHLLAALLIPFAGGPPPAPFDPPLYIALDPVPPRDAPPAPEEVASPAVAAPAVDPVQPEEPADRELESAGSAVAAPADPPESTAAPPSAPAAAPAPESSASASASNAAPEPAPAPPADTPPADVPEAAPAAAPPPPPSPPPQPTVDRGALRSALGESGPGADETAAQLAAEQAQFEETLAEWNALQEELQATASSSTASPSAADQRATQQSAASLANDLSRLTAAIQASSRNVVTTGSDAPARQSPNTDPMRGDGSGIAIGDGAGTRVRTSGSPVTLDGISLGAAFPPSYPVVVDFTVDAAGRVLRPTVRVPSPEPALDQRIKETVATWIFESAPAGSPPVRGSVTIVVDASTAR